MVPIRGAEPKESTKNVLGQFLANFWVLPRHTRHDDPLGDPEGLVATLRRFFRYCASRRHTRTDFSGLVPPIRRYRHASLPKGLDDSVLGKMLQAIPRDTPVGARDYAIVILMMAYGIRGVSAAQLLLDDLDWQHSRIRIRAQKGGKEVVLPLMQAVGEALIQYLQHRPGQIPCRKLFLCAKAPFRPLDSMAISRIVRHHLTQAGVKTDGSGSPRIANACCATGETRAIPMLNDSWSPKRRSREC